MGVSVQLQRELAQGRLRERQSAPPPPMRGEAHARTQVAPAPAAETDPMAECVETSILSTTSS